MKVFRKIKEWLKETYIWFFSKRVTQAINNGATYEEVCKIVEEEMKK